MYGQITTRVFSLPEHGGDVKHFSDEDEDHGDEYNDKEDDESPRVTRSNLTYTLYRRTAYVTRICAHVTDTAAVGVFLDSQNQ